MRAGKLQNRVEIQRDDGASQNDLGEHVPAWATYQTVWAQVTPLTGQRLFNAAQVMHDVTHEIRMRWQSVAELTPNHRIKWGTRIFEILSIVNWQEQDAEAIVSCREHVGQVDG
jgi:SPP1 family predicted phage head-tail adaptor